LLRSKYSQTQNYPKPLIKKPLPEPRMSV